MIIFGLDPGSYASGWACWDSEQNRVIASAQETTGSATGATDNSLLLSWMRDPYSPGCPAALKRVDLACIEQAVIYRTCDRQLHDTILYYGRVIEAIEQRQLPYTLHDRSTIKSWLCPGLKKIKDPQVNASLLDKVGPKGTQKNPGPTYGLKGHSWQALAAAVYGHYSYTLMEGVKERVAA